MTTKSKHAIDAPRGTVFRLDPEKVNLVTDENDLLYDKSVHETPSEEFIEELKTDGQIQPIAVCKREGRIDVVVGRRRVLALREINRRLLHGQKPLKVVASYVRGADEELFRIMVAENMQRAVLAPIDKAELAYKYMNKLGASTKETATLFRVTAQTIRDWGQLLQLPENVKEAVNAGEIKPTAARELRNAPKDKQAEILENLKRSGCKYTVQETRKEVRNKRPRQPDFDKPPKPPILRRKEIEAELKKIQQVIVGEKEAFATGKQTGWIDALQFVLREGCGYED